MWCSGDRKFLIILFLLLWGITCQAQYHPQYSQYMFSGLAINPAYAGSLEVLNLVAIYRSSQWGNSVDGAPVTQTFAGDFPLRNPQLGLGLTVFNDKAGYLGQSGAYFAYAFRVRAGEGKLSLGMQAGFDSYRLDLNMIDLIDPNDPLFTNIQLSIMPNVGAGAYYHTPKYFVGLSFPKIMAYKANKDKNTSPDLSFPNTMLYGGYIYPAGKNLKIKPSTLLHYAGKQIFADLNCNAGLFDDKVELGVSWRMKNTLTALAQFRIQSLCIGYAHDFSIGKPNAINTTHEIMLRYDFKIVVKATHPLLLK